MFIADIFSKTEDCENGGKGWGMLIILHAGLFHICVNAVVSVLIHPDCEHRLHRMKWSLLCKARHIHVVV
jgi:hypothetical protein